MQKLKLDLDTLRVDSFDTTRAAPQEKGTVAGHQQSAMSVCGCVGTVFTTACYDTDGNTEYDDFREGPGVSEMFCTMEN